MFHPAKHSGESPTQISLIADSQAMPVRFREVILNRLKRSGLLDAKLVVAPCPNCRDAIRRDLREVYHVGIRWSFLKPPPINQHGRGAGAPPGG